MILALVTAVEWMRNRNLVFEKIRPTKIRVTSDGKISILPFSWGVEDIFLK